MRLRRYFLRVRLSNVRESLQTLGTNLGEAKPCLFKADTICATLQLRICGLDIIVFPTANRADLKCSGRFFCDGKKAAALAWIHRGLTGTGSMRSRVRV